MTKKRNHEAVETMDRTSFTSATSKRKNKNESEPKQITSPAPPGDDIDSVQSSDHILITNEEIVQSLASKSIPFMDTFYILSNDNSLQRNTAASQLLQHIFFSEKRSNATADPNTIIKDGLYTLTRLIKGLSSSRVHARIGFATCLTHFLRMSFNPTKGMGGHACRIEYMMKEYQKTATIYEHPQTFIYDLIMQHNSITVKKKTDASKNDSFEEKDLCIGQLFGISAMIRSGILFQHKELDQPTSNPAHNRHVQLIVQMTIHLFELYSTKIWLRESTTAVLIQLFSFLHEAWPRDCSTVFKPIFTLLFQEPVFVHFWKNNEWSMNTLAILLHFQTLIADYCDTLFDLENVPASLRTPVFTCNSLAQFPSGQSTSETNQNTVCANVTSILSSFPPDSLGNHVVWDVIWAYLTISSSSVDRSNSSKKRRNVRSKGILCKDSPIDLLEALLRNVIVPLLVTEANQETALSFIERICCTIAVPTKILETVILEPNLVRKLFINSLHETGRTIGRDLVNTQSTRTHIISRIVEDILSGDANDYNRDDLCNRRLAVARAFARVHPSFDLITHSTTVNRLLDLEYNPETNATSTTSSDMRIVLWGGYFSFLLEETKMALLADVSRTTVQWIDALFHLGKRLIRLADKDTYALNLVQNILDILMTGAFFQLKQPLTKKDKKKGSSKQHNSCPLHIESFFNLSSEIPSLSDDIRSVMSSRFFSLLTEIITNKSLIKTFAEDKSYKPSTALGLLKSCVSNIVLLERLGLTLLIKSQILQNHDHISEFKKSTTFVDELLLLASSSSSISECNVIQGFSFLIISLYLQLLIPQTLRSSPRREDCDDSISQDTDDDVDELREDISDYIFDLFQLFKAFKGYLDGNEIQPFTECENSTNVAENPLSSLASTCINILSSFRTDSNSSRGAGCKLMKENVKVTWNAALSCVNVLSKKTPTNNLLQEEVVLVILESICSFVGGGSDDNDNEDPEESSEANDDANVFVSATIANVDLETGMEDNYEESTDDESDLMIDDSGLQNMLIEDSDDASASLLEHHKGADKALARLLRIKHQARKAGRLEQEKHEISHQLRCFPLLESLFSSSYQRTSLPIAVIAVSLFPLLKTLRILDQGAQGTSTIINSKSRNASNALLVDKKALAGKIKSLLEEKVTKIKFHGTISEARAETLIRELYNEMKKSHSNMHSSVVSSCMIIIVKASSGTQFLTSFYKETVHEWSTKATTKVTSSHFQDLISRCGRTARLVLTSPLAEATEDARTPFLKAESYSLLSKIYHEAVSLSIRATDEVNILRLCGKKIAEAATGAFNDESLIKSKRIRSVLKVIECLAQFAGFHDDIELINRISKLASNINQLHQTTESTAIKDVSANVINLIDKTLNSGNTKKKNATKCVQP